MIIVSEAEHHRGRDERDGPIACRTNLDRSPLQRADAGRDRLSRRKQFLGGRPHPRPIGTFSAGHDVRIRGKKGDCSIATGADSKIARQEQGESTWDPLNASELAPNSANGLIPSLIAWAKSQPPGNDAIVSNFSELGMVPRN